MASLTVTSTVDSEHLAARAAKGDSSALSALYEHWSDRIYRWVLGRTGGMHHATEDVCSDVWLKVARHIRSYAPKQGTTGFVGWLFTIAQNCITDSVRAVARRREVLTGDMLAQPHAIADGPGDLDTELAGPLADALTKIHARRAEVIRLRFYVGLTVEETAEMLGTKVGVIRSLQCRALKDLKSHLGSLLVAEPDSPRVRPLKRGAESQRGVPTC